MVQDGVWVEASRLCLERSVLSLTTVQGWPYWAALYARWLIGCEYISFRRIDATTAIQPRWYSSQAVALAVTGSPACQCTAVTTTLKGILQFLRIRQSSVVQACARAYTEIQTTTHKVPACTTCKRLRKSASACYALGHHAVGYVSRRPQSQLCKAHKLPPCPRCALKQWGVRHCCSRGHHRVCTLVPTHRKRTLSAQPLGPNKKRCLWRPARPPTISLRSPHCPPTPLAPKRRRPKSPAPPSPPTPVPQGPEEIGAEDAVSRQLFMPRHGRSKSAVR